MSFFDILSGLFDHIGIACISLLFLFTLYVLYRAYKAGLPSLDIDLSLISRDTYREILEKKSLSEKASKLDHDLYLRVQMVNSGKRIICPTQVCDDKERKIITILTETGFEYVLKKDEEYSDVHPLNENAIKIIRESERLYVKDFAERKFSVPRKQFEIMLSEVNNYKK